ncbi:MAG: hypothetical protein JNG89_21755 [Planctomycetaceae bacterium]|nr:hypothetical protein [Planctomycetaceae bacterium]
MSQWRRALEAFGVGFRLETNRPELLAPLLSDLPPSVTVDDDRPRTTFRLDFDHAGRPESLLVDGRPHSLDLPADSPLDWQFDAVVTLHVAEQSPFVFVHAGVVRYRQRAILFPGRSFAGKSTLTAALLSAGAEYLSDDFAVLDDSGLVHPFHCPLRLRTSAGRLEKLPADFGAASAEDPTPVGLIVDTQYSPGANFDPRRLTPGETVLRMFAHAVAARSAPARVGSVLARVARNAACLTGPRGDAAEAARQILNFCDQLYGSPSFIQSCETISCCP